MKFDGAPRYLGNDEKGREVLSFIDGQVPLAPYPTWSMTDEALISLGHLLSRFHRATASLGADLAGWRPDRADPGGGPVICHNDLFPENVVFRNGRVFALIDFDMAAPGRPLWDLAIAIQEWAPLHAPQVRWDYPQRLDAITRAGTIAHAYGIKSDEASDLVEIIFAARENTLAHIRAEIADGSPFWRTYWHDRGQAQAEADDAWLRVMRDSLTDTIAGRSVG
jgi:thiamine kinase-like enzyme